MEQFGWQNNLEIVGVLDNVEGEKQEKVVEILQKIKVNISTQDIDASHRVGKSKNNSKKTIVSLFKNMQKKLNKKGLRNIGSSLIGLSNVSNIGN